MVLVHVFTMLCGIILFMGVKKLMHLSNCTVLLKLAYKSDYMGNKDFFVLITYKTVICSFLHICSHCKGETTLVVVNVITN